MYQHCKGNLECGAILITNIILSHWLFLFVATANCFFLFPSERIRVNKQVIVRITFSQWGDMPQRSYLWTTRLCGVVLYSLVFVFTCHFWQVGPGPLRGQPELLLFMLPGIVMALLQVESPLKSTLMMGLWGTLLGALLLNNSLFVHSSPLFVLAWCLSALFWAGCGALLVRLMQIVMASLH